MEILRGEEEERERERERERGNGGGQREKKRDREIYTHTILPALANGRRGAREGVRERG